MIVVRLFGGLGNQMFQYAAARRLAHEQGTELLMDLRWFGGQDTRTPDLFSLRVRARAAPAECLVTAVPATWTGAGRRTRWRVARAARRDGWRLFAERVPGVFDPAVMSAPDRSQLVGYWQSERYFGDNELDLRGDLSPRRPPSDRAAALGEEIEATGGVSVHVRRGDFAADPGAARAHGTCPPDYYRRALRLLDERLGSPRYYVFSDDPGWAIEHLDHPRLRLASSVDDRTRPEEELALMASCRSHVIANSSFSWWGAWLGRHPEKIVVAPAQWFADPNLRSDDIVPETWLRL